MEWKLRVVIALYSNSASFTFRAKEAAHIWSAGGARALMVCSTSLRRHHQRRRREPARGAEAVAVAEYGLVVDRRNVDVPALLDRDHLDPRAVSTVGGVVKGGILLEFMNSSLIIQLEYTVPDGTICLHFINVHIQL